MTTVVKVPVCYLGNIFIMCRINLVTFILCPVNYPESVLADIYTMFSVNYFDNTYIQLITLMAGILCALLNI